MIVYVRNLMAFLVFGIAGVTGLVSANITDLTTDQRMASRLGSCRNAYLQARTDLLLAVRRSLGADLATYRDWNGYMIHRFAGLFEYSILKGESASLNAIEELIENLRLNVDDLRTICPDGYEVVPVGFGACVAINGSGQRVEPLQETRSRLESSGVYVAYTRFTRQFNLPNGTSVTLTRGFVESRYDLTSGAITQGNPYGITTATQFNGLSYHDFLVSQMHMTCGSHR
jgi:hypothetical protein